MMIDDDLLVRETLERQVPVRREYAPDWYDVVRRAGVDTPADVVSRAATGKRARQRQAVRVLRGGPRQRVIGAIAIAAALVGSTLALAATQDWWFFGSGAPEPAGDVVIVKTGTWQGAPWTLTAYRSKSDGLCFGLTPHARNTTGEGAAMVCASIVGVTPDTKTQPVAISALAGASQSDFPAYVVGPVAESTERVEITLSDGRTVDAPTFEGPAGLGASVRFYSVPLPCASAPVELRGLAQDGSLVGEVHLREAPGTTSGNCG
jgi:hypothetical protein